LGGVGLIEERTKLFWEDVAEKATIEDQKEGVGDR
jgi:hypothetical protein